MTLKSIEKLREIAADVNASEIVDHMKLYPSCVFDGAWLDAWHAEFDRVIDRLEAEIAERYTELPVDADGVPIRIGDILERVDGGPSQQVCCIGPYGFNDAPIWCARDFRHVKPRTLTDVLCDLFERKMTVTDAEREISDLMGVDR